MKLYLDEDIPAAVAPALRRHGLDVVTTVEAGNGGASDPEQLEWASRQGRTMVTRTARDYIPLARTRLQEHRAHPGIILVPARYRGNQVHAITAALLRVRKKYPKGIGEYQVCYLD